MECQILKMGNKLVIPLSQDALQRLGLEEGSTVSVIVDDDRGRIVIGSRRFPLADIDATFAQQVNDFVEKYRPALEALAK